MDRGADEKRVKIQASPLQRYEQPGGWNAKKAEGLFEGREVLADLICLLISSLSRVSRPD